ncbi:MAG: hypothetical protein RLZZ350_1628 [Verrucomicrobiota bacterium]|jgi:MFS family permease
MNRKPSLLVVWLTVFIDLVGFGIVVPLVPLFSKKFALPAFGENSWLTGAVIGVIIASFSAMQFIFSPIWGRLSDRHGRRPILLISTAGAAISYVIFAFGSGLSEPMRALLVLGLARAFAGACGGNITVAQAYIADITPPENRSAKMGLIGMAFGLGFIFGPAIGGISLRHLGATGPGWIAAGLCAANFLLALCILPESRQPSSEPVAARPRLTQWSHTFAQPKIGLLVAIFFCSTFCFSCFESTLALLVCDNFRLDIQKAETIGTTAVSLFVFCGVIGAFVQGGMIKRLVKKLGEPKLIVVSLVLTALSLAVLPFIKGYGALAWGALLHAGSGSWWLMLGALAVLAVGSSLTRAPLFGLLSNLTPANEQGATIGVAQSAGSLARVFGPLYATTTLHYVPALPFVSSALVLLAVSALAAQRLRR